MSKRMLRVQATRTFQAHTAGDVLLVEEAPDVLALVRARLFDVLAIESDGADEPVVEPAAPAPVARPVPTKAKPKAKRKPKAKAAKSV